MPFRILLVDDEINVLKSLKRVLTRSGYDTLTATSGYEAIEILSSQPIAIVITDFRMPHMNGADLLRRVKQDWPDCVNLVLSGYTDFKSVVELLNQGLVYRFLEKPWVDDELLDNISQAKNIYLQKRAQKIRDQLLIGSMSALVEIDNEGIVKRFNAPAMAIITDAHVFVGKNIIDLDLSLDREVITAFLTKKSSALFINFTHWENQQHNEELMVERYLSDDFYQLLKLTVNTNSPSHIFKLSSAKSLLCSESDFYEHVNICYANNEQYSVVYVGVAQFQLVNDLLGIADANSLSKHVLDILQAGFKVPVKIYQKHSDRFAIYVPQIKNDSEILHELDDIMNDFYASLPGKYMGMHVKLFGIYALYPQDELTAQELINQMQLTINYQGSNLLHFSRFDAELVADYKRNFDLSCLLLSATTKNEFSIQFQPKIDVLNNKMHGVEVLIRWFEPSKYGWISPAQFIPIAECDGQIIEIGRWVIAQSCQALKQWQSEHVDVGPVAVNVSGRQLQDDPQWIDYLLQCVQVNGLSPSQIELEITETFLIEDISGCQKQLVRLRKLGFKILIDDFGVGYSSLSYLSKLSVDGVKLDKALINDVESCLATQSMIRNIARMSHDLHLKVIAEGVETAQQYQLIKKLGCDYIQGFYFSAPLEYDELSLYLKRTVEQGIK